jgi:hypothetical protein
MARTVHLRTSNHSPEDWNTTWTLSSVCQKLVASNIANAETPGYRTKID